MLRKFCVWLLNTYFGNYIEDLNADQLSYAILKGEVELENLPLKRDALRSLNLPIRIRKGFIGKLKLQLASHQYVLQIDGVYLVAEPFQFEDELDIGREAAHLQEIKLSALDAIENDWKTELGRQNTSVSNDSVFNYISTTTTNILENLQLKVNDVHIRYEDQISDSLCYICDITADKLHVQSCDSKWLPNFVDLSNAECSFKLVELDNLSVSWNHKTDGINNDYNCIKSSKDLKNTLKTIRQRQFLISPVSMEAYIKRNCSSKPLDSINTARIVCDVVLDNIQCFLTDFQYSEISQCLSRLENINRIRRFLCYRPIFPILINPRSWWIYLMKCFSVQSSRKLSFRFRYSKNYIRNNIRYIKLYIQIIQNHGSISISNDDKQFKEFMEWDRDFDELRLLREVAMRKAIDNKMLIIESQSNIDEIDIGSFSTISSYLTYLFPSYWWCYTNTEKESPQLDSETAILEENLKKTIIDSFAEKSKRDFSEDLFKQDCVFCQFNFSMKNAFLYLCNGNDNFNNTPSVKFELKLEDLQLKFESSPRNESLLYKLRLGAVYLFDHLTENTLFPDLIEPIFTTQLTNNDYLLMLFYEINPNNNKLQIESKSLRIIYSPTILNWIIDFVCKPIQKTRITQMKNRTKRRFYNKMESILAIDDIIGDENEFGFGSINSRTQWKMKFDIAAPQVYFVEDLVSNLTTILRLDFGEIRMMNCVKETWFSWNGNHVDEYDISENLKTPTCSPISFALKSSSLVDVNEQIEFDENWFCNKFCDKFRIEFTELQVLAGSFNDNLKQVQNKNSCKMHILDRFNIIIELEKRLWQTTENNSYPNLILNANLPTLSVHLNEFKIQAIQLFLDRIVNMSNFDDQIDRLRESNSFTFIQNEKNSSGANFKVNNEHYLIQFSVDDLTISMESHDMALAELQVRNVALDLSHKAKETVISLSIHEILLVDALQKYGSDYCLLLSSNEFIGKSFMKKSSNIVDLKNEFLIDIEVILIGGMSLENIRSIHVHFNSVDCVTNKETIGELIGLLQTLYRKKDLKKRNRSYSTSFEALKNIEFTFNFNRLRMLLIRPIYNTVSKQVTQVRKIGVVSLSGAKINAVLDLNYWSISGSLASVQIIDQTKDDQDVVNLYKKVFSVGLTEGNHKVAFNFSINKDINDFYEIEVELASVFYTYIPEFLVELQLLIDSFINVTDSIREATSGFAIYDSQEDLNKFQLAIHIRSIKVLIDSPVIIIPRSLMSTEIFVINLGRILLISKNDCDEVSHLKEQYHVEIRKMNLYSIKIKSFRKNELVPSLIDYDYAKINENFTIIDDTIINFTINRHLIENQWMILTQINQFKLSLIRNQYEQFWDTIQLFNNHFRMLRERFTIRSKKLDHAESNVNFSVYFQLDNLMIELKDQISSEKDPKIVSIQKLINLVFSDLSIAFNEVSEDLQNREIRFSLQSFYIEDLLKEYSDINRFMVKTKSKNQPIYTFLPKSCSFPLFYKNPSDFCLNIVETSKKSVKKNSSTVSSNLNETEKMLDTVCQTVISINRQTGFQKMHINFHKLDFVMDANSWAFLLHFFNVFETHLSNESQDNVRNSQTHLRINSLSAKLINSKYDLVISEINQILINMTCDSEMKEVIGELGSILVKDLTPFGQLYRNRLLINDEVRAMRFKYCRKILDNVVNVIMEVNPFIYIHTKRFINELQKFFNDFLTLREFIDKIQTRRSKKRLKMLSNKMVSEPDVKYYFDIMLTEPKILIPVHSTSTSNLLINLSSIMVKNSYQNIVTAASDTKRLLNIVDIELKDIDLLVAKVELLSENRNLNFDQCSLKLGDNLIARKLCSLLSENFNFVLKFEMFTNRISELTNTIKISSRLSKIDVTLTEFQYQMLRGIFVYNFGEDLGSIVNINSETKQSSLRNTEKFLTFNLDLMNVTLRLVKDFESLTSISFIRSYLTVDVFNNGAQDIDLVSEEIRIHDTRSKNTGNLFREILKPITLNVNEENNFVQLEIHSRRKVDGSLLTIIVKDMQVFLIYTWWSEFFNFLIQKNHNLLNDFSENSNEGISNLVYKINLINSEVVLLENETDSNSIAVFLRSTMILNYELNSAKWLTCTLQDCEMFSCFINNSENSALSIIDPLSISMDILQDGTLELEFLALNIRLSYNDIQILAQLLASFRNQLTFSNSRIHKDDIENMLNLVQCEAWHCRRALNNFKNQCEYFTKAFDWLKEKVIPFCRKDQDYSEVSANIYTLSDSDNSRIIEKVTLKSGLISIILIDDCDTEVDVPLIELLFANINLTLDFDVYDFDYFRGEWKFSLLANYYNRLLSGWEPFIEPSNLIAKFSRDFFWDVKLQSCDLVNINLTKIFLQLIYNVKNKWLKSVPTVQTRKPFVPFALSNKSGLGLIFRVKSKKDSKTYRAENNDIIPFSFESKHMKKRHRRALSDNSFRRRHQISVKIDGWMETIPISVDRVGVYFRHASVKFKSRHIELPPLRIVFDVTLENSARKLVTIRSAIQIENLLEFPIEIQFDNTFIRPPLSIYNVKEDIVLDSFSTFSVPVQFVYAFIRIRPLVTNSNYQLCDTNMQLFSPKQSETSINYKVFESYDQISNKLFQFCIEIIREPYPLEPIEQIGKDLIAQPGHMIRILPNMELINCLPCEMQFSIECDSFISINPFSKKSLLNINMNEPFEIKFQLENFYSISDIRIEPKMTNYVGRVRLRDVKNRELILNGEVVLNENTKEARKQIRIYCSYYIENKSELPLIFKQCGAVDDAAGQLKIHEQRKIENPLLFSFEDFEGSQSIIARIGNKFAIDNVLPQWSNMIYLQLGIQVRRLLLVNENKRRSDASYLIGIEIQECQFSPNTLRLLITSRYQIFNKSSHNLDLSQTCLKNGIEEGYIVYKRILSHSHISFDWPCFEKSHHLVIRLSNRDKYEWSGGFSVEYSQTIGLHGNDSNEEMFFIHLEVVEKGATIFLIFTDFVNVPPAIRVDNYSDVSLQFIQSCCKDTKSTISSLPRKSVIYALSEPLKYPELTIYGPSSDEYSDTIQCDLQKFGPSADIRYENFLFIAFTTTFFENDNLLLVNSINHELVFSVDDENNVILAKKRRGNSQMLWRLMPSGQLQYEGKKPATYPDVNNTNNVYVLDIADFELNSYGKMSLMIRKLNPKRLATQTWHLSKEGRMMCRIAHFCVQVDELVIGAKVFLTRFSTSNVHVTNNQKIVFQKMRPGSGLLKTNVSFDGPTKVLSIMDSQHCNLKNRFNLAIKNDEGFIKLDRFHFKLTLDLEKLGLSIVTHALSLELLYLTLNKCSIYYEIVDSKEKFVAKINNIQCDNQLFDAQTQVVLYDLNRTNDSDQFRTAAAVNVNIELVNRTDPFWTIFKEFTIATTPMAICLDETLIVELFEFFSDFYTAYLSNDDDPSSFLYRLEKRYAFEKILIKPNQIVLSMNSSNQSLQQRTKELTQKFHLRFFQFGDAFIVLNAFNHEFLFERASSISTQILRHFYHKIKWQGIFILGAINLLGNPVGFLTDVSEGVVEFLQEGNVGALVKNVTHGISDSAAKVTESISHGLGKITMDEDYMRRRYQISQISESESAKAHFSAAIQNFSNGFTDGVTGMFRMIRVGAENNGFSGAIVGLGKGVVGAVAKPVIGVLDLTTGTAKSFRALSVRKSRHAPNRQRLSRCITSSSGLLPVYCELQSRGQCLLFQLNNHNYNEKLIFFCVFQSSPNENLCTLISNEMIRIIMIDDHLINNPIILKEISYNEIMTCNQSKIQAESDTLYYFEIVLKTSKVKFRCDCLDSLDEICRQIEYGKQMFDEKPNTLSSSTLTIR